MKKENLEEKIRNLKDKIADARDYISSDFCTQCIEVYKQIETYQSELDRLIIQKNGE